jgi:pimeloyl-ACP methyl ester carboxylesterase
MMGLRTTGSCGTRTTPSYSYCSGQSPPFPDNSHIYDDLIPHLTAAGRRTIAFDFLGFGASDKPEGAVYSFEQQLGDLEAVADALRLEKIVPVGHDAGGPAAVNFALRHPTRAAGICLPCSSTKAGSLPGKSRT